ncbi:MAG: hypothetical protein AB1899_13330 [Pseudomonadota bacterium]
MANPGDTVRWYAEKKKWPLLRKNIMVEGDRDVRYCVLASQLYSRRFGKWLVGKDLSMLSAGSGDRGGTEGLFEEFPTLTKLIQTDCDGQCKPLFRLVALLDNDRAGQALERALLTQYRTMKAGREIFLLNRVLPRRSSEPNVLARHIAEANSEWKGLECEIEDLLGATLLDAFLAEMPNAQIKPVKVVSGHRHFELSDAAKGRLVLYTKENALLEDLSGIVELLKSLRFYLGLDPDGA